METTIKEQMRAAEKKIDAIIEEFEEQASKKVLRIQLFREPPTTLMWIVDPRELD